MNVMMTSREGYVDAVTALYMSKRHVTEDLMHSIKREYASWIWDDEPDGQFNEEMKKLKKYGKKHITLLKFISYGFYVSGMHRGGQDDWDSHAKRFDNRIVRESTRLAKFEQNEMSDYYKGKIKTDEEIAAACDIPLPNEVILDGANYIKTTNGYVNEKYARDQDVLRGLYMLSIPSSFIFQVNLAEFCHIYKLRNKNTSAHPEVRELCERIADLIEEDSNGHFNRDFFMEVEN